MAVRSDYMDEVAHGLQSGYARLSFGVFLKMKSMHCSGSCNWHLSVPIVAAYDAIRRLLPEPCRHGPNRLVFLPYYW